MNKVEDITYQIEELREKLCDLINENTILTDSRIVEMSKQLDMLLNNYNKVVEKLQV